MQGRHTLLTARDRTLTLAADSSSADTVHRRRESRIARQARVGILRNINEPPRPPPRKATLTGRWLSLRSSRRPAAQAVVEAALAVTQPGAGDTDVSRLPAAALRHDEQGRVAGIDVAGLMASVAGLGTSKPIRTPYGAEIRPDMGPKPAMAARTRAKTATEPEPPPEPGPVLAPPPPVAQRPVRRRRVWPVLAGVALAFVALVLLPALMDL